MGLDYIRAQTGKPWRKRWNGGLDRLKSPSLLDLTMTEHHGSSPPSSHQGPQSKPATH